MDTSRKTEFFDERSRLERLQSPEIVQRTKAVRHPNAVRRAKVKTVNDDDLTCKLLDKDGEETGSNITVSPVDHLGARHLTSFVWPALEADDVISVFKDVDGEWYTTFVFDDYFIRRAYVKNSPGASSTVTCYLDYDVETAVEITVQCSICGGGDKYLNEAIPRIVDGDLLFVTYMRAIDTWYCQTLFQTRENCVCTPP